MIAVTDYVPMLSGRAAEMHALAKLDDVVRARVEPLIEVTPLTFDQQSEQPVKSIETHLSRTAYSFMDCWGSGRPLLVDAHNVDGVLTAEGRHPVTYLHDQVALHGVAAVPVTALDRRPDYQAAVASVAREFKLGTCVRLDRNQCGDPSQLAAELFALCVELDVDPEDVDLVIDLGALSEDDAPSALILTRGALQALPAVHQWRSVVIAASSFPLSVSSAVKQYQSTVVRRAECEMYEMLAGGLEQLPRLPAFADYGIEGAAGPAGGVAPVFYSRNISASIRYTGLGGWYLVRGGMLARDGYEQYRLLAKQIIDSPHWRGANYSRGDDYLARCAAGEGGTGTPKTWREAGLIHHVTSVTEEISDLLGA